MKAWIARDKDGALYFYLGKPSKFENVWASDKADYRLDRKNYPQVKWEDEEPTKVEVIIKIKED